MPISFFHHEPAFWAAGGATTQEKIMNNIQKNQEAQKKLLKELKSLGLAKYKLEKKGRRKIIYIKNNNKDIIL